MNLKKYWPIRKGCMRCRSELLTGKEKFTRTCNRCAEKALEGFQDMSEGNFRSGFKKVIMASNIDSDKESVVKSTVKNVMSKKRRLVEKKVLKQCKKEGLNEEEAKEYLKRFDDFAKD